MAVREASTAPDRGVVLGLGAAAAHGALAQGAFLPVASGVLVLAVALAALARLRVGDRRAPRPVLVACACWAGFAVWALLSGLLNGWVAGAVPSAALALALCCAAWAAAGLPEQARRVLHAVLLAAAAAVALSGWAGVALHAEPLALPSSGLWRAASTITYANATAALLVVALALACAAIPASAPLLRRAVVAVLLLGVAATLSRAGAAGLAVVAAVLAVATPAGERAALRALWPAVPAAAVAFAGLLPSLPVGAAPRPDLAAAGLVAGAAVIVLAGRPAGRALLPALVGGAAAVALLLAPAAVDGLVATRATAASPERDDAARVTWQRLASAPVTGVGPGQLDLVYLDRDGTALAAQYTHDEYLQTAAETGAVGLALALAGAAALLTGLRRSAGSAAAVAATAAFALHSAFDFLWHVPVLPLLLVLTVVTLRPPPRKDAL